MTQLRTPENSTLPIDSTSEIRQYKVVYGCGDIADPANDPLQIVVYIYDSRQDDGGNFFATSFSFSRTTNTAPCRMPINSPTGAFASLPSKASCPPF